ncbi:Protein W01F3.1 b, partial [Aphelenchoides avenae]
VRVSVRATEVIRPVILHLYASKERFQAPVIVHANTFESRNSLEKAVDPVTFVDTVRKLLPEAIISLGWTPSGSYLGVNRLDWDKTFRLMGYVADTEQPLILNMKLNDAAHSVPQLEWILGLEHPTIYIVVKGELSDIVDSWTPLEMLMSLTSGQKLLFDVDDTWRSRIGQIPANTRTKREIPSLQWRRIAFVNPYSMQSTAIVSSTGTAFVGWPNALLVSTKETQTYPSKQRVSGKVLFLPKRQVREISPNKQTGMIVKLFETDPESLDSPEIDGGVTAFIGYNGRVSIRNDPKRTAEADAQYHEGAAGQIPKSHCYEFDITDRGWRVEMEVWSSEACDGLESPSGEDDVFAVLPSHKRALRRAKAHQYRTFIQLDTPITK